MADVKISALPAGTANANAVVPATNAAGTTTQKITLGAIAALGGGPPAAHVHGNLTNAGAIGSTSGQIVVTTTGGALTTSATVSAATQVSGLATVATSGSYNDLSNKPAAYTLPTAAANVLGGVKIGSGVTITDGVISVSSYTLPSATVSTLGGVIVGTGLGVSTGTVSVTYGTTSGTACQGNDSRLSDARTPTAHASTHQTGGSDAVANVVNSPSQITANQNNYTLPSADIVRLDANAARDITGFEAGTSGQSVLLVNVGTNAITLKHQNTSSSASNRIVVPWAGDYVLDASGGSAVLVYDSTTSRWRVLA